jgi:adenylate cyclase
LRPQGDISVVPLVRTARPIYRPTMPQRTGERELVMLYCDFRNRADLASDHLPQDLLYVLTLYVEGVSTAIRAAGGVVSTVEFDSICALFGHEVGGPRAAQGALRAAGAIEGVISDLNNRLGRQQDSRLKIAVSIHSGRAAVGEIGSSEPPLLMAVGDAVEMAGEIRKAVAERDKAFAISEPVYAAAGLDGAPGDAIAIRPQGSKTGVTVFMSDTAPVPSPAWTLHGELGRRAMLKKLWAG